MCGYLGIRSTTAIYYVGKWDIAFKDRGSVLEVGVLSLTPPPTPVDPKGLLIIVWSRD